MNEEKYRCSKCGAFEVVFADGNDPLGLKPSVLVCKKCGYEYEIDSGITAMGRKNVNTFPNPDTDLDVSDPLLERIKSKRRVD